MSNKLIPITLKIRDLFRILDLDNNKYETEQASKIPIYVKTPKDKLVKINYFVKKHNNVILETELENGVKLKTSDKHIVLDSKNNNVLIKNTKELMTLDGIVKIKCQTKLDNEDVYDISIPSPHLYYTPNKVIHHNTATARSIVNDLGAEECYINGSLETSVDVIRNRVIQFAMTHSVAGMLMDEKPAPKIVIIDECLEENEEIRVGTVDNWKPIKLKDFEFDKEYPIVSMNLETQKLENDTGVIISDRYDEVYEIELEDGRKITVNSKHPFFQLNDSGEIVENTLDDSLEVGSKILCE